LVIFSIPYRCLVDTSKVTYQTYGIFGQFNEPCKFCQEKNGVKKTIKIFPKMTPQDPRVTEDKMAGGVKNPKIRVSLRMLGGFYFFPLQTYFISPGKNSASWGKVMSKMTKAISTTTKGNIPLKMTSMGTSLATPLIT